MLLQTLIKIGKALSTSDRNEWEDFLNKKVDKGKPIKTKEGEEVPIKNYVATLFCDLDNHEIKAELLAEYEEKTSDLAFYNIDLLKGNNKAIYTCVVKGKCEQLRKTFWGVPDKDGKIPNKGQFTESLEKEFPEIIKTPFAEVLQQIFSLKNTFESQFLMPDTKEDNNFLVDENKLFENISLSKTERIAIVVVSFVWKEKGYENRTFFKEVEGYEKFLRAKFLKENEVVKEKSNTLLFEEEAKKVEHKLCYASGETSLNTTTLNINARYSLNKMFVETTQNYASRFEGSNFNENYQIDTVNQQYLERGSDYLLHNANVNIANVTHCIIPRFLSFDESTEDIIMELGQITHKSELLFKYSDYIKLEKNIEDKESDLPYWITFLGFESDGNSLKTVNLIEDVSSTHFKQLQKKILQIDNFMRTVDGINWQSIMSKGKDKESLSFNFYSLYMLIPIGKNSKVNPVLMLFKALLEQHTIKKELLLSHFKELVLCHRFGRHKAYAQKIREYSDFDYAIRDVVFQYHALFQFVSSFNLFTNMEENPTEQPLEAIESPTKENSIEAFFTKMGYNDGQKALFYLGRALNSVARTQKEKGHDSKPILSKLNYNGMDKDEILRLDRALAEKANQYKIHDYVEPSLGKFRLLFNANNWQISSAESLFYILSGYSFWVQSKKEDESLK